MVFFKWLDHGFIALGGFVGLSGFWIGRKFWAKYFRVSAEPTGPVPLPLQRLLIIIWAIYAAHGVCAIVIHPDNESRIYYGALSLLFISSLLASNLVALKAAVKPVSSE